MVWFKRFLIVALIALIVIQFFRPERNNGGYETLKPFLAETGPSEQVQGILKTACYDCHTDQTDYPWYNNVAPVSFFLNGHIVEGKHHLNFSAWNNYSAKRKDDKLKHVVGMVGHHSMPLSSYTLIHHDAKLSPEQTTMLVDWAKGARLNYASKAGQPQ